MQRGGFEHSIGSRGRKLGDAAMLEFPARTHIDGPYEDHWHSIREKYLNGHCVSSVIGLNMTEQDRGRMMERYLRTLDGRGSTKVVLRIQTGKAVS